MTSRNRAHHRGTYVALALGLVGCAESPAAPMFVALNPVDFSTVSDLAHEPLVDPSKPPGGGTGADLATAVDLGAAPDLATIADLAAPPDFATAPDFYTEPSDLTATADLATPADFALPPDLAPTPDLTPAADLRSPADLSHLICPLGQADCNGLVADGCEVTTDNDRMNCGACGSICALNNAQSVCSQSKCLIAKCDSGFADCNKKPADGCEVNLDFDVNNCGHCGSSCAGCRPHATPACDHGQFVIGTCDPGWHDVNHQAWDGCEAYY